MLTARPNVGGLCTVLHPTRILYNMYCGDRASIRYLCVLRFTELRGNAITRRIDSRSAYWDGQQWVFEDVVVRTFDKVSVETATPFTRLPMPGLSEHPEDFTKAPDQPDEMGFAQLAD